MVLAFQSGGFALVFQGGLGVSMAFTKTKVETYIGGDLYSESSDTDDDSFLAMGMGFQGEVGLSDAAALFFGLDFGYPFDDDWEDWYGGAVVGFGTRFALAGGNILGLGMGYKFTGDPEYPVFAADLELGSAKLGDVMTPCFGIAWRRHSDEWRAGGTSNYTITSVTTNDYTLGFGLRARVELSK